MTGSTASVRRPSPPEETLGTYLGWYLGAAFILIVLGIATAVWFIYHP
ncbi:MAG: hypothetical protein ACREC5_03040 [Thermoplasmata archaeon]